MRFDLSEKNKVLPSTRESLKHFIVKALIGKILHERGYGFVTEAPLMVGVYSLHRRLRLQ